MSCATTVETTIVAPAILVQTISASVMTTITTVTHNLHRRQVNTHVVFKIGISEAFKALFLI